MLDKISIGIKTFLRDEKLFNTIFAIRKTMPEAQMIIADCGEHTEEKDGIYADLRRDGHEIIQLELDAGFGRMSNAIVNALERPLLLIGSDDFDFQPPEVRQGIEKLARVLRDHPELDIASGRVDNRPYERDLFINRGVVTEFYAPADSIYLNPYFEYIPVDLTVNYCLIRKQIFWNTRSNRIHRIRWDENVKIGGGEHGAFFYDIKQDGFKVGYVPGVNINQQSGFDDRRYREFRWRAQDPARPCFDKRGIIKYVLANGQVDYEKKN